MNTMLLAGSLVKLNSLPSPNHNSTLQNVIPFLRQTVTPYYKPMFTFFALPPDTVLSNLTSESIPGAVHFTVK